MRARSKHIGQVARRQAMSSGIRLAKSEAHMGRLTSTTCLPRGSFHRRWQPGIRLNSLCIEKGHAEMQNAEQSPLFGHGGL